jgi:hypothetical protein
MTIHSDWARLLKEECPRAFLTNTPRSKFGVGIIDGHLQLMCLHNKLSSWKCFVNYLFLRPIMKLFDAGCPRVVLCFDCYDNVPVYKNMTQLKRSKGHKVCVFNADQDLPRNIPDDPMLFLMNRDFKKKVIDLVCTMLPKMVELRPTQELFIDYKRVIRYTGGGVANGGMVPSVVGGLEQMGESDVKYARYVDMFGNALVHAIDGDYLAIALLYYCMHGIKDDNKIFIFRQLSSLKSKKSGAQPTKKLKNVDGFGDVGIGFCDGCDLDTDGVVGGVCDGLGKRKEPHQPLKKKEAAVKGWVDMQMLFVTIANCVFQNFSDGRPVNIETQKPFTNGDAVHSAVILMLSAGTDFSRGLPFLGPKTIWDTLPSLCDVLLRAASCDVDEGLWVDGVVAKLYKTSYVRHLPSNCLTLTSILKHLMKSSLSSTTKSKLPTQFQVETSIKNVKWVVRYWKTHNGLVDTPLDGSNGFSSCENTRQVIFTDKSL